VTVTQIVIVVLAAAVAAVVKGTTGMGYPLTLIPVLALFIDISDAVVIVAPSNLYLNASISWSLRGERHNARTLRPFVLTGAVGAALGAVLLELLPDRTLRLFVVAVIVVFVVNRFRGEGTGLSPRLADRLAAPVGGVAGFSQGAAGLSGPLVIPWFLSLGLSRDTYIFCITWTFALTGMVQIVVFAIQGTFTLRLLLLGLGLIPVALAMLPIGVLIRERISVQVFERAVVGMLIISAASIVIRLL
jgi:uncharacterized membrane protein YfcA